MRDRVDDEAVDVLRGDRVASALRDRRAVVVIGMLKMVSRLIPEEIRAARSLVLAIAFRLIVVTGLDVIVSVGVRGLQRKSRKVASRRRIGVQEQGGQTRRDGFGRRLYRPAALSIIFLGRDRRRGDFADRNNLFAVEACGNPCRRGERNEVKGRRIDSRNEQMGGRQRPIAVLRRQE